MRCIFCGKDTKVIDKRDAEEIIRRRRECISCDRRFTTYERPEINLMVIKKDGRREGFSREKILAGVVKASEKRPVSREMIEKLVDGVESDTRKIGDDVETKKIGDIVMRKLKKMDEVAYIRFASVYRSFDGIGSFEKELRQLKEKKVVS